MSISIKIGDKYRGESHLTFRIILKISYMWKLWIYQISFKSMYKIQNKGMKYFSNIDESDILLQLSLREYLSTGVIILQEYPRVKI